MAELDVNTQQNNDNPNPLTLEERVAAMEKRVEWQDHIHRNVGQDGNIYHYWNVLPMIGAASCIGVVVGIIISRIFKPHS